MSTNDNLLPFLNRLLYSFSDGYVLWKSFVDSVKYNHIFVNEQCISDHSELYFLFYTFFNQNKLLTKYALVSCTQMVFQDIYNVLEQQLTDIKSYITIRITTTPSGFSFHIKKRQDPHLPKSISIYFEIKKHITSMNLDMVFHQIEN